MNKCVDCCTPNECAAVNYDCGHDDTERDSADLVAAGLAELQKAGLLGVSRRYRRGTPEHD